MLVERQLVTAAIMDRPEAEVMYYPYNHCPALNDLVNEIRTVADSIDVSTLSGEPPPSSRHSGGVERVQ